MVHKIPNGNFMYLFYNCCRAEFFAVRRYIKHMSVIQAYVNTLSIRQHFGHTSVLQAVNRRGDSATSRDEHCGRAFVQAYDRSVSEQSAEIDNTLDRVFAGMTRTAVVLVFATSDRDFVGYYRADNRFGRVARDDYHIKSDRADRGHCLELFYCPAYRT